jgi:predicted transcriptional regulator
MDELKVSDLMIPVDRFVTISHRAKFYDALTAMEDAQEKYLAGQAEQRILLVRDDDGRIIGKLSPIDLLRGLETNYNNVDIEKTLSRFGQYSILKSIRADYNLWENPFKNLCSKAVGVQIMDFLKAPPDGQIVHQNDSIIKCFHLFIMNRHDSLFVVDEHLIVGLLRFSDVYRKIAATMKDCHIETSMA